MHLMKMVGREIDLDRSYLDEIEYIGEKKQRLVFDRFVDPLDPVFDSIN